MKLGSSELNYIRAFERISRVQARDCVVGDKNVTYIVMEKDMGQAIGKNGLTIKKAKEKIGKEIELLAYSKDPETFVKKAFYRIGFQDTEIEGSERKVMLLHLDSENRRKMLSNIGKLKKIKEIVKRNYAIEDIKVK